MDAVNEFYKFWSTFGTGKQFTYVDEYNPAEAPNRRIKRIIEDENKKARAKERRMFNETLRELINHVKWNDKRKIRFDKMV